MLYTIQNEALRVVADTEGAELHAIFARESAEEYLWQGDVSVWYGRSPVLFPIVGALLGDTYRYHNNSYRMPKHGFARKRTFTLQKQTADSLTFCLESDAETFAQYPFRFTLQIDYTLQGSTLLATYTVENHESGEMPFSLGAHPGFFCEMGDKLLFAQPETVRTHRINADNLLLDETFPLLENSAEITITPELFVHDALILQGLQSQSVTLWRQNAKHLRFAYGQVPYLGIWAKPGAPYVCLEPWFGVNDDTHEKADIREKTGIQILPPGECFRYTWSASV